MADINTAKYTEAKDYWDSQVRTYTGNLPRCLLYNMHRFDSSSDPSPIPSARLGQLLDTGYLDIVIYETGASKNTGNIIVDGASQTLLAYALINTNLYFVLQARQAWIAGTSVPSSSNYIHPCYDSTGTVGLDDIYTHIGNNADCPGPVTNPSKYIEARYKTDSVTYDPVRYPASNDGIMAIPLVADNASFWQSMQDFIWNNSSFSDLDSYTYLVSGGIDSSRIKGLFADWNDMAYPYESSTLYAPNSGGYANKTIQTLCDDDPRFDYPESSTTPRVLGPLWKYFYHYLLTMEIRAKQLESSVAWLNPLYCSLYTLVSPQAGPFSEFDCVFTTAYGRAKGQLEAYAFCYFNDDGTTLKNIHYMQHDMSRNIAQYAEVNCHMFDVWWTASTYYGDLGSGNTYSVLDDPASYALSDFATIAQAIGFAKFITPRKFLMISRPILDLSTENLSFSPIIPPKFRKL